MPVLPHVGQLTGAEKVAGLLADSAVLDPATNVDARAWRAKLGTGAGTLFDAGLKRLVVGPITFFDTNNDGKVDAYRAKATFLDGSIELLDVVGERKTYGLVSETTFGSERPLSVWKGGARRTGKRLPAYDPTAYDLSLPNARSNGLEGWSKQSRAHCIHKLRRGEARHYLYRDRAAYTALGFFQKRLRNKPDAEESAYFGCHFSA